MHEDDFLEMQYEDRFFNPLDVEPFDEMIEPWAMDDPDLEWIEELENDMVEDCWD